MTGGVIMLVPLVNRKVQEEGASPYCPDRQPSGTQRPAYVPGKPRPTYCTSALNTLKWEGDLFHFYLVPVATTKLQSPYLTGQVPSVSPFIQIHPCGAMEIESLLKAVTYHWNYLEKNPIILTVLLETLCWRSVLFTHKVFSKHLPLLWGRLFIISILITHTSSGALYAFLYG